MRPGMSILRGRPAAGEGRAFPLERPQGGEEHAVCVFPDGHSALMLVCARLRFVSSSDWGTKKYLNMEHLFTMERENQSVPEA